MNIRKKRIAFLIDTLNKGGTEKATLDLVNSLNPNKYDITVIRFYPGGFYNKQLESFINNKVCYPFGKLFFWNKRIKEKINWRGRWLLEKLSPNISHKLFIGNKYDIEIACGFHYPTKVVSASKNAKRISWVHMDFTVDKSDIGNFSKEEGQEFFGKVDQIICVSKECEDKFNQKFDMRDKTCFCYNIVDSNNIIKMSKKTIQNNYSKDEMNVVAIGRLTWQKGFDRLLRVHKALIDKGIQYHLTIIGEGEDRDALASYIKKNDLESSVSMIGFVENPYPYIKKADVFICSSRYESYGLVVAESIVLETPVVSTDCAGPNELLGNGEYGLIVDNSENGIELGLEKMLTDTAYYNQIKKKVVERKALFDKNRMVKQWEQILDKD